ncbi:MAG: ABC transporter permease [Candidatus Bathyarchaeia archaeon]|jgi:peptide/nickel transport system permease protein
MSLRSYIIARIILTIPTIMLLLTFVFLIIRVLPGDPASLHFEKNVDPATLLAMKHELGLDKPLLTQYFDYLIGLTRGDFGKSMQDYSPVSQQIFSAFPATLELAISSTIIMVVLGVLLGVTAARSYNTAEDHSIRVFGIASYAIPVFFLGMVLIMIFAIDLHWLPAGGRMYPGISPAGLLIGGKRYPTGLYVLDSILEGDVYKLYLSIRYLVLPSLALGLVLCGIFIRLTRSNMLETLQLDFVTAARARGLKERTVVYGYALRNAFLPILTMMGLQFAALLAGAILTETTFSWPGLGRYLVDRISFRDYTAIQGVVVFFGLLVTAVSLVVDILYAYLDPRIRL